MEQTQNKKTFSELRTIYLLIEKSIKEDYLSYEELDEKENIVMTYYGYYAHIDNCAEIENEYYHTEKDEDDIVFDEIDNEYILRESAKYVLNIRNSGFCTHENNCIASNDIYLLSHVGFVTYNYLESNNYGWCEDEEEYMHLDDLYYHENSGGYYSYPEDEDEDEDSIIQSYSYKPNPKFFGNGKSYLGIELEVENKKEIVTNGKMAEHIQLNELYFKMDGSLSNGFEIVSHPMTFDYIKGMESAFNTMLEELKNNGFNSYDSGTCGMHIHISKNMFGTWHLFRFLKFFQDNKEFIVKISQRKTETLQRWAAISEDSNDNLVYYAKKKTGNSSRYVAINLQNQNTIELRIFRGTLNFASFMKNIEFTDSLYHFTMDNNSENITLDNYKEFIKGKKEYKNLNNFIKLKNI